MSPRVLYPIFVLYFDGCPIFDWVSYIVIKCPIDKVGMTYHPQILSFVEVTSSVFIVQGSYASGKCQGNLKFFKVRELSGNFMICQGKLNFC